MKNQAVIRLLCPKSYNPTQSRVIKPKPPSKRKLKAELKTKSLAFFLGVDIAAAGDETHDSKDISPKENT